MPFALCPSSPLISCTPWSLKKNQSAEIVPKAHATAASSGACSKWAACPRSAPEFPIHMSPPIRLSTISITLLVLCPLSSPGPFSCCNPRSLPTSRAQKNVPRAPAAGATSGACLNWAPCPRNTYSHVTRQPAQDHHHLADALPLCPPCQLSHSLGTLTFIHTAPVQIFLRQKRHCQNQMPLPDTGSAAKTIQGSLCPACNQLLC